MTMIKAFMVHYVNHIRSHSIDEKDHSLSNTHDKYIVLHIIHRRVPRKRVRGKNGGEIPQRPSPFLSRILSFYIFLSVSPLVHFTMNTSIPLQMCVNEFLMLMHCIKNTLGKYVHNLLNKYIVCRHVGFKDVVCTKIKLYGKI